MTFWYVNRAAGIVAWALLSASVLCGLLVSSKALGKRVRINWLTDLHRGLSGLAVIFTGIHVLGAVGDNYLHFGWSEVLVPFTSAWRPVAIAWGVVSGYLLLAIEGTSLLRKHLSKQVWRAVHLSSFALFVTATLHGVTAGTEMGTTAGIAVAALVTAAIAGLTTLRVMEARQAPAETSDRIPRRPAPPTAGARTATTPSVAPRTVGPIGGHPPVAGPAVAVHRHPEDQRIPHEVGAPF